MSSLKAINDTMNKVEEYTEETSVSVDRLDKNFQKWFEMQRRAALDAEEDRREAKKAMAAMGAAGRAGKSGNQDQQGGGPGLLTSIAAAIAALPPGVKLALGITAGATAYKTGRFAYRTATLAPFREAAERLGQRLVDKAQEKRRIKEEIAAAEKAEADRIRREQLVKEQMEKEQQDRINSAKAREEARIRRQATALTDIESAADKAAENARRLQGQRGFVPESTTKPAVKYSPNPLILEGQRGFVPENIAKAAAKSSPMPPKITMGTSLLSTPSSGTADINAPNINAPKAFDPISQKFVTQDFGPVSARDLIPNIIESTKRVRLADVVPDLSTQAKINDIETKNNVRISVTSDGKIDIRSADPSKPGAFVSKDVFNKTMVDLTSPKLSPKSKPKIRASRALGPAGLVLEGAFAASNAASDVNAIAPLPSVMDTAADQTRSVDRGEYTKYLLANIGAIPGEMIDFGAFGLSLLTGKDLNTEFGKKSKQALLDVLPSSYGLGGVLGLSENIEFGPLRQKFLRGSQDVQQIIGESFVAGLELATMTKTIKEIQDEQLAKGIAVVKKADPETLDQLVNATMTPYEQRERQLYLEGLATQIDLMGGVAVAMEKLAAQGNNNQLQNYNSGQNYLPSPSFNIREMSVQKILDATSVPNRGNN